jgi:GTPase SAR1 family protein
MGSCCSAGSVENKPLIPIAVIGLPGVGKTSLIEFLCGEYKPQDPPIPTGGLIQRQVNIHDRSYVFYDVCGYTRFADSWVAVIQKSVGVILLFDKRVLDSAAIHVSALYDIVSPELVRRRTPTLVLVNGTDAPVDVTQLETLNASKLSGGVFKLGIMTRFDPDVLQEFEWMEKQI